MKHDINDVQRNVSDKKKIINQWAALSEGSGNGVIWRFLAGVPTFKEIV